MVLLVHDLQDMLNLRSLERVVALLELAFDVLANLTASAFGLAPERPIWLRRVVQALWLLLGLALLALWAFGMVLLVRFLTE